MGPTPDNWREGLTVKWFPSEVSMPGTPKQPQLPEPRKGYYTYPPRTRSVTVTKGKTNHGMHAMLTLLTGGLWAPVWISKAYNNQAHQRIRTTNHYYG